MQLLASGIHPTVTEVATGLGIARATVSAILSELVTAGWAVRDDGLRYGLGDNFIELAGAAVPRASTAILAELAHRTQCGATLSRIGRGELTVLNKQQGGPRSIPGLPVGQAIPLAYPAGASVMPWLPATEQATWLSTAPDGYDGQAAELLRSATEQRVVVFRPVSDDGSLVDVLADLLDAIGDDIRDPDLRTRVIRQLSTLTARPYTADDLDSPDALPVSYLAAPVFTSDGSARHEIQLGPLQPAVSKKERHEYIAAVRAAADALSTALG